MKKIFYRVAMGDSVLSVSQKFKIPIGQLIFDNRLSKEIECGDLIVIYKQDEIVHIVEAMEDYESISKRFLVDIEKLKEINRLPYVFLDMPIYLPK